MPDPGRSIANVQPPPNPAEPGNVRALTHGANSPRLYEPRARDLLAVILDANPHLDLRDGQATGRLCELYAMIERVCSWLSEQSDPVFASRKTGKTHAVLDRLDRWYREARSLEDHLAISPLTRTKLGLDRVRGAALEDHLRKRYGGEW